MIVSVVPQGPFQALPRPKLAGLFLLRRNAQEPLLNSRFEVFLQGSVAYALWKMDGRRHRQVEKPSWEGACPRHRR
jgi:hypothetical protein